MPEKRIEVLNKEIGDLIRRARILHGVSPEELGRVAQCSSNQIQSYETAKKEITAAELYLIAKSLHVPVENFFEVHICEDMTEGTLETEAYHFLKIFSEIESGDLRKKILDLCKLYEELQAEPSLSSGYNDGVVRE